jgi:hypothetical protein
MFVMLLRRIHNALYTRYHPEYKWLICDISYSMLLPAVYGLSKGLYSLILWPVIVFFTSQLRWRDPIVWKDRVDRLAVACALFYHVVIAWHTPATAFLYFVFTACGIGMFFLGVELFKQGFTFESHLAHAALHIFASIGNFVLYWGVNPITQTLPDAQSSSAD